MKNIVNVTEVQGEGLTALLGENVVLLCANYFYAGKLAGVNESCVLLADALPNRMDDLAERAMRNMIGRAFCGGR